MTNLDEKPECPLCGPNAELNLKELERYLIAEALRRTNGHVISAAKLLGVGKTTLYRKMKRIALHLDNLSNTQQENPHVCPEAGIMRALAEDDRGFSPSRALAR